MKVPKPITKLIEAFERLPGIGPKTAQRLTFYLLHFPEHEINNFAEALTGLKQQIRLCNICKNVAEDEICSVCDDVGRNKNIIAVVANPLDVFALEKTGFKGVYHVLHGIIDPLNGIGPDDIFIKDLLKRVQEADADFMSDQLELILATNTSIEGEATSMYLTKLLRDNGFTAEKVKLSRIARGLPVGGDIEYADDITLSRALEGRITIQS